MKPYKILLLLAFLALQTAAIAQGDQGGNGAINSGRQQGTAFKADDPAGGDSHQWLHDMQDKGAIPKGNPSQIGTNNQLAQGSTDPGSSSSGGTTPADNIINSSVGSVDKSYHGQTQYYKDDLVGNWIQGITHGDPTSITILAVVGVVVAGAFILASKKSEKK